MAAAVTRRQSRQSRRKPAVSSGGSRALSGSGSTMIGSAVTPTHEASQPASRRSSWAAVVWAVLFGVVSIPTFGLGVVLAPVGVTLTVVAWRRAPHDGLFWVGATLN